MKIDFITFCHPGDAHRLYAPGWLQKIVNSHQWHFDNVIIIQQRMTPSAASPAPSIEGLNTDALRVVPSELHPNILTEFGLPENDPIADEYTHGPTAAHYWKWHVINHLIGLKESDADFIVFSDNDCLIRSQDSGRSWVIEAMRVLKEYPQILIVGPGDGATMAEAQTKEGYRLTRNVSQQLFVCERQELMDADFDIDWGGEFNAPGGPMQEYYYMLEGRIWRYLEQRNMWRCIMPDYIARYWHCNRLTDDGLFEGDYSKY